MTTTTDGVALFDSVLQRKKAELGTTTLSKKLGIVQSPLPSLSERGEVTLPDLKTLGVKADQSVTGTEGYSDPLAFMSDAAASRGAGYVANQAGSVISGIGRLANLVSSAPNAVLSALAPVDRELGQFVKDQFPTLNRVLAPSVNALSGGAELLLGTADEVGNRAQVFGDLFYNNTAAQQLQNEVGLAFDDSTGAATTLVNMAKAVATNPSELPGIIGESLPVMFAMAQGGSLLAGAYFGVVGENIDENTQIYKDTHNGNDPTGQAYEVILAGAVAQATIEMIESRFILGKQARVSSALRRKSNILGVPVPKSVSGFGKGALAEAGEEGSAAFIGEVAGRQDTLTSLTDPLAVKPAAVGAVIGAAAGGTIKGGVEVAPDIAKATKRIVNKAAEVVDEKIAVNTEKRIEVATKNNDSIGLAEIGLEKDLTRFNNAEERKAHILENVAHVADARKQLEGLEGKELEKAEARVNEATTKLNTLVTLASELKAAEEQSISVADAQTAIAKNVEKSQEAVTAVIAAIEEGRDVSPSTVKTIRGSALFNELPKIAQEKIQFQDEYNQLNTSRIAGKSLEEVASDINEGNKQEKFIGLKQHKQNVTLAIAASDYKAADTTLTQLKALRQRLADKLSNPSTQPNQPSYATGSHSPGFVNQLTGEINDISTTMRLLDSNVRTAFNKSPLSDTDLVTPTVTPFGGTPSKPVKKKKAKKVKKTSPKNGKSLRTKLAKIKDAEVRDKVKAALNKAREQGKPQEAFDKAEKRIDAILKKQEARPAPKEPKIETKAKVEEKPVKSSPKPKPTPAKPKKSSTEQSELKLEGVNEKVKPFSDRSIIESKLRNLQDILKNDLQTLKSFYKDLNKILKSYNTIQQELQNAGGLSREAWSNTGVDKALFKMRIGGKTPLFPATGGLTVEEVRAVFIGLKYKDRDWTDESDVTEAVVDMLEGEPELVSDSVTPFDPEAAKNELQESIDAVENDIAQTRSQIDQLEKLSALEVKPATPKDTSTKAEPETKTESKAVEVDGIQINVTGYHYTESGNIDPSLKSNKEEGALFFFDSKEAAERLQEFINGGKEDLTGKIIEGSISFSNAKVFNASDLSTSDLIKEVVQAKKEGYDGVIADGMVEMGVGASTQYAVFDTKKTHTALKAVSTKPAVEAKGPKFVPVPAFNALLDMVIPTRESYEGITALTKTPAGRKATTTYRELLTKQDDILRGLQQMIRECNG